MQAKRTRVISSPRARFKNIYGVSNDKDSVIKCKRPRIVRGNVDMK